MEVVDASANIAYRFVGREPWWIRGCGVVSREDFVTVIHLFVASAVDLERIPRV